MTYDERYMDLLLRWMVERMEIWWWRYHKPGAMMFTRDPIMRRYKFTNVYRILDRSTQYMLNNVTYPDDKFKLDTHDMIWRVFLYKHFNLPWTWTTLEDEIGPISLDTPVEHIMITLERYVKRGYAIYSPAYFITAPFMKRESTMKELGINGIREKYIAYLRIFSNQLLGTDRIERIYNAINLEELYLIASEVTGIGGFMAYQVAQDWNYHSHFAYSQNEFVFPGVGTVRGVHRIFSPEVDVVKAVKWTHTNFEALLRTHGLYHEFRPLPGYLPQLPDIANCFCEADKYMRAKGIRHEGVSGTRIKNTFKPARESIHYIFPKHMNINL